ncbi:uncharacterized protein LOC113125576 isoform X2 [Mastacembelus armatus]|uniref:uncharacterized protein LOC113125576 isoform X2 n=1 Tax=Mastacembelus armatus TaxID=205130 RepID=UPI000E458567|nr:uncharacterized protein LOC113125576 isoform X2 [Mastacembelus armatus]
MGCSGLLILGLVLNVAHCLEILDPGDGTILEITHNITAVLGEDVYLSCNYLGKSEIQNANWKRQINSKVKTKGLAGFSNNRPFNRSGFSMPGSPTNLTVRMSVSSVDVEGEYICEFESEEEYVSDNAFVTVVARPDIQILVNTETINGTHYQSVSCSAVGGRPPAHISWLVNGRPPSDYPFTVNENKASHSNGTSTLSSILRFPTHLQDEDSVTCEVQHLTLPNPKPTTVRVETYARPNVTIKAELVEQGRNKFWVVSCISSGGRPDTDISLALNTNEELQIENNTYLGIQTRSIRLPASLYEGHNVTCMFDHPKFTHRMSRVITLPSFYFSGVRLLDSKPGINGDVVSDTESLELQEGQSDTVIGLQVIGNVPRYNVTCKKDDGPLPGGVELIGSNLTILGPVDHHHAGLYECAFSYHHLKAMLHINITVKPQVLQPVPPTIRVDLQIEDRHRVIECSAADAVPAANMSWLLPEDTPLLSVSVMRQQNSHLWLAVCDCIGEGAEINLTWVLPDKSQKSLQSEYEGHALKSRLTYEFPLALHEGQNLTCVYNFEQRLMERRSVHIPRFYISAVRVLNHTTTLQSRYSGKPIIHRLSLQENHHKQKILLHVEGNVPQYDLSCKRSDGSLVYMEGLAIVFQPDLSEQDEGLYTCQASFYHHKATVDIQVEIMSQDKYFVLVAISCVSSASAIVFILVATLWVCCKRNSSTQHEKQESLSALTTLMQDPSSPEAKKQSKEYAHLVSYSIVFDVKSTV